MLERFLFTPDMQYTPISKLSGGEKRRLYLLSVLVSGANVLILDEPSNNVDIPTLTVLEDFLNTFVGIVITVSHDRYFLDNVVDRIFEFDGNGNLLHAKNRLQTYLKAAKNISQAETLTRILTIFRLHRQLRQTNVTSSAVRLKQISKSNVLRAVNALTYA